MSQVKNKLSDQEADVLQAKLQDGMVAPDQHDDHESDQSSVEEDDNEDAESN